MTPAINVEAPHRALASFLAEQGAEARAFSPDRLAAWDRSEAFPTEACAALDKFGLSSYYVPHQCGGRLRGLDTLMQSWRAVASHDLTVAIAHGKTFLGTVCIWIAGDQSQRDGAAHEVLANASIAWGLTERGHGADLLASELHAARCQDGWRINGEKWLINNATRGALICVLARTSHGGDTRGFSLFLVDKRRLRPESLRYLPKVRTHGIRGADISGIAFDDAWISDDALIGTPGAGIEIVLKALQLTRSACAGLSLGATDHAFRLTLEFMSARELYGRKLIDLPVARRLLGEALAMQYAAEAVGYAVTRGMAWLPQEMSVMSAISKAFVPATAEKLLGKLGELLGARAYLDHVHGHGLFQKLERDHRIVPIFDGSTVVNQQGLINQFPMLARGWRRGEYDANGVPGTFAASSETTALPLEQLSLVSMGGCSVVQALPASVEKLKASAASRGLPDALAALATQFATLVDAVMAQIVAYEPMARAVPATAFELARRYELCFAGAACIQFWLYEGVSAPIAAESRATWLHAALTWLIGEIEPHSVARHRTAYDALAARAIDDPATWTRAGISLWATQTGTGADE
jgi:alkylation response protein AidB-like acyl-CoA dehydrogenase